MPVEEEIPEQPSSFIQRLAETGRAEIPLVGDVLVFDKAFWRFPKIWKLPFVDGYIPTWNVISFSLSALALTGSGSTWMLRMAESAVKFAEVSEEITLSAMTRAMVMDQRVQLLTILTSFFTSLTIVNIGIALKHYGLSKEVLNKGRMRFDDLLTELQEDPDLQVSDEKSLAKMIFSAVNLWRFVNQVRDRVSFEKQLQEVTDE
ncbi:hypothetical protein JW766_05515 [Candidatus Dojkabacteria bacterium]|nr:hypothetical protein [Candidatus Dojkabacteria bacterium]